MPKRRDLILTDPRIVSRHLFFQCYAAPFADDSACVCIYSLYDDQMAVLLANTTYRPALQRLVNNGSMEGAQQDWSLLEGLRYVAV